MTMIDEEVTTLARLQQLARSLAKAQIIDAHGRFLHIRISRLGTWATREQEKHLAAICGDLANQIGYDEDGKEFWNIYQASGVKLRMHGKDAFRHMFAAIILKAPVVRNPELGAGGPEWIVMSESTKKMNRRQYADAITLALAFGDMRDVKWSDPDKRPKEKAA